MSDEVVLLENDFGLITNRRVVFTGSDGNREDVALGHVSSVSLLTSRSWTGLVLILAAPAFLLNFDLGFFMGAALVGIGCHLLLSRPQVCINLSSGQTRVIKGAPSDMAQAQSFTQTLSSAMVVRSQ